MESNTFSDAVSVLGVRVQNLAQREAIEMLERLIVSKRGTGAAHGVYIVNAHTLNLAYENRAYRSVLNSAHHVLADGTGVRWAARMRGIRLKDNLVGTDLVPALFHATAGRGYRYFLLGARHDSIERATAYCTTHFNGWDLAGCNHGYTPPAEVPVLIRKINAARPDLLLVAMGNPLQEQWIHQHLDALEVPVCIGVGGLFDHWSGGLNRAPHWVRKHGFEWLQILIQQPHKWRRYLLGNPKFLYRIVQELGNDRKAVETPGRNGDVRSV